MKKKNIKKKIFVLRMKKKIIIVSETPKKIKKIFEWKKDERKSIKIFLF